MSRAPRVAIVVPLTTRSTLLPDEAISFRHLRHFLNRYDTYLLVPRSVPTRLPGCESVILPDRYFGSLAANRSLMLSRQLYRRFEEYDYILLHHLDALVFDSRLESWCGLGLDYIGSPWLRDEGRPELGFSRVGNGGLSLRRVSSFLAVFDSRRPEIEPERYWQKYFASRPAALRLFHSPRRLLKRFYPFNNVRRELRSVSYNEDFFWSNRATHYYPRFQVASVEVGLRFSFEVAPRFAIQHTGGKLPFGCHAWSRHDRAFWEPFLLQ
jgi:hypothetical protein